MRRRRSYGRRRLNIARRPRRIRRLVGRRRRVRPLRVGFRL